METLPLSGPPTWLRRAVEHLIPPAAREGVAGDLWERYRNPVQYIGETLLALPFVIASQIRRNANLPVTGLQTLLLLFCLEPWSGAAASLLLAAGFLLFLLLQAAYQGDLPPSPARAALETVMIAFAIVLACCFYRGPDFGWTGRAQFILLGPALLPALCILRAWLALNPAEGGPEDEGRFMQNEMTAGDILRNFRADVRTAARRNRIEMAGFAGASLISGLICACFHLSGALWSVAGVYGAAAVYLLAAGSPPVFPVQAGFVSVRTLYQRELARQDQLRRLMWWLWLTPPLSGIYASLISAGQAAGDARPIVWGLSLAVLLCFVIGTVNRERGGRIRQSIARLGRIRERKFC